MTGKEVWSSTEATTEATTEVERIRGALHQVVLLRETGPKSAAWHRARVQTIWRLHARLERYKEKDQVSGEKPAR